MFSGCTVFLYAYPCVYGVYLMLFYAHFKGKPPVAANRGLFLDL